MIIIIIIIKIISHNHNVNNYNKWYHVKVLWLHHRISAAININAAFLRACLHGGGGPQVGEVTRLGGVTRLSI